MICISKRQVRLLGNDGTDRLVCCEIYNRVIFVLQDTPVAKPKGSRKLRMEVVITGEMTLFSSRIC